MKKVFCRTVVAAVLIAISALASAEVTHYVRYDSQGIARYGVMDGERIYELDAAPYLGGQRTGASVRRKDVRLLAPAEPSKVFATGFNYLSHRGDRELPPHPPIFLKLPSSVADPNTTVHPPQGASVIHYEAEMVLVIGRTATNVSVEDAGDYIFGVTAGNDISERLWQSGDLQWFRGKASDDFGPIGPSIAVGLDYNDLLVQSRLNGEVMQSQRTRDFIHDAHAIVSHISKFSTLYPGDLIFTGTPGTTSPMEAGDVIEIEVEGVGVLRNTIGTNR